MTRLQTLTLRVERLLRTRSMPSEQLAVALGIPPDSVVDVLHGLAVVNVGFESHPVWTWRAREPLTQAQRVRVVQRLLLERPMTVRHLSFATGFPIADVGLAIKTLRRRHAAGLKTLGRRRMWFLVSPR